MKTTLLQNTQQGLFQLFFWEPNFFGLGYSERFYSINCCFVLNHRNLLRFQSYWQLNSFRSNQKIEHKLNAMFPRFCPLADIFFIPKSTLTMEAFIEILNVSAQRLFRRLFRRLDNIKSWVRPHVICGTFSTFEGSNQIFNSGIWRVIKS